MRAECRKCQIALLGRDPARRSVMTSVRNILIAILLFSVAGFSQTKITIPAGTPEDKALTEISQENDNAKRIKMLEDFVQTYASNKSAVAYGYWQLSQQYTATDVNKALGYGDKALAAMPDVLDILQSQCDLAQQAKDYSKVVDYATRGAVVINAIEKQPKPENSDEQSWTDNLKRERESAQPIYDYMATAAYNAMASETDAKKRVTEIERFSEAFKGSKLMENVNLLAVATYQEMNDMPKLMAFGEKALAADPKNASLLTLMANAFAEDPKGTELVKADAYSRKAIELIKADTTMTEANRIVTEGFAHQVLGYSLLRQEKTPQAIGELKTSVAMLQSDSTKLSIALYRLGYAYAKSKQNANAKEVLTQATEVNGPFQQAAKELLAKVEAAPATPRRK
jgi:tetratricopeptide (TPR) repeat protein